MPELNDQTQITDEIGITKGSDPKGPVWAEVKVTGEDGLFKNGKHYKKGDTAHFSLEAAKRFEENGDCKILKESVSTKVESETDELGRTVNEKVVLDE